MKFSVFTSVACLAASVFAAPAIADNAVSTVDASKRDLAGSLSTALADAISEVSAVNAEISSIASGVVTTLDTLTDGLLNLNSTLTIVVDALDELSLGVEDTLLVVIDSLLGLLGLDSALSITTLLTNLEASLEETIDCLKKLTSGTILYDELEDVAAVIAGTAVSSILSEVGSLLNSVIALVGSIVLVGPVITGLVTALLSAL